MRIINNAIVISFDVIMYPSDLRPVVNKTRVIPNNNRMELSHHPSPAGPPYRIVHPRGSWHDDCTHIIIPIYSYYYSAVGEISLF